MVEYRGDEKVYQVLSKHRDVLEAWGVKFTSNLQTTEEDEDTLAATPAEFVPPTQFGIKETPAEHLDTLKKKLSKYTTCFSCRYY